MSFRLRPTILLLSIVLSLGACARGTMNDDAINLNAAGTGGIQDPTSVAYFNQTIGDRVLFEVDQSTISPEGQSILSGQAAWLLANTEYTALIEGHADEQGTREYNLALGARRASSVRDFLVSQGVPDSRLRTISYGKERPLEICSEEACYRQNRRAVTVLSAGLGA